MGAKAIAVITIAPIMPSTRFRKKYVFGGSFVAFQLSKVFQHHFGNNASSKDNKIKYPNNGGKDVHRVLILLTNRDLPG